MACDTGEFDSIEACRTCGIYYMSTTNYLRPLFQSAVDNPELLLIRMELAQWKIEINESDGLPQYLCSSCIHEFQKLFKFRSACHETQDHLRAFYKIREQNLANVKIKTEILDTNADDGPRYDFIYVDDFSDGEYDSVTPFNFPHVPIKEELIEAATVPQEDDQSKPVCIAESASAGGTDETLPNTLMASQQQTATVGPITAFDLEEDVECEFCYQNSSSSENRKKCPRHCRENHDIECHICGKVFKNSTPNRFNFHLKWHNLNKRGKCKQCKYVGSSRQALKKHKQAVHAKVYCKICGKGVLAKKMKAHLRGHEIATQYSCEYCAEVLSSEKERDVHVWQVHANRNSPEDTNDSQCAFNAEEEESADSYDQVITVGIMCALCEEKFVNCSDLQLHVKLVHFNAGTQWPQIKTEKPEEAERMEQDMSSPSEFLRMSEINSSPIRTHSSFFEDERLRDSLRDEASDTDQNITVFEDYDNEEESCDLSNDFTNNDINTNNTQTFFPQTHSIMPTTYGLDDDDAEFKMENFCPEDHGTNGDQEQDSANNLGAEEDPDESAIQDEISQYACAKCTNSFATIAELREHYKQHQLVQNKSGKLLTSTPTKSVFKCHICDKRFDLKFSLNRHVKRHDIGDVK